MILSFTLVLHAIWLYCKCYVPDKCFNPLRVLLLFYIIQTRPGSINTVKAKKYDTCSVIQHGIIVLY